MIPPAVGKLLFLAIGTSMWFWMRGYVKIQELLHGPSILIPKNRTLPPELNNKRFGEHVYLDINDITMHYVKKGCDEHQSGPILLLLHGFLDFWYTWNNQIHYLGKDFCVVAPDLRGYGWTSKPTDPAKYRMVELVRDIKIPVAGGNLFWLDMTGAE
ncbi:epoxide hydrolase 4-like isoform X3 [Haemaphysalis longicornis]